MRNRLGACALAVVAVLAVAAPAAHAARGPVISFGDSWVDRNNNNVKDAGEALTIDPKITYAVINEPKGRVTLSGVKLGANALLEINATGDVVVTGSFVEAENTANASVRTAGNLTIADNTKVAAKGNLTFDAKGTLAIGKKVAASTGSGNYSLKFVGGTVSVGAGTAVTVAGGDSHAVFEALVGTVEFTGKVSITGGGHSYLVVRANQDLVVSNLTAKLGYFEFGYVGTGTNDTHVTIRNSILTQSYFNGAFVVWVRNSATARPFVLDATTVTTKSPEPGARPKAICENGAVHIPPLGAAKWC